MLIEFRVENFLSFKKEVVFSMVANKDETLKNNLFKLKDFSLKKSVAIFGPNGTGKTNLINALALTKFLVTNSKDFKKEEEFMEHPFKLDSEYGQNKAIKFKIKFYKNKNIYDYFIKISIKQKGEREDEKGRKGGRKGRAGRNKRKEGKREEGREKEGV